MSTLNPAAEAARETARTAIGQFGNQQHSTPDEDFLFVGGSTELLRTHEENLYHDFSDGSATVTLSDGEEIELQGADVVSGYSVGPIVDELADGTLEARWKTVDQEQSEDPFTEDGETAVVEVNAGSDYDMGDRLGHERELLERRGYTADQIFFVDLDKNTVLADSTYEPDYGLDEMLAESHPDRDFTDDEISETLDISIGDVENMRHYGDRPVDEGLQQRLRASYGVTAEQTERVNRSAKITDELPASVAVVGYGTPGTVKEYPEWDARAAIDAGLSERKDWADGDVWGMSRQRFTRAGEPIGEADTVWRYIGDEYSDEAMKTGDF